MKWYIYFSFSSAGMVDKEFLNILICKFLNHLDLKNDHRILKSELKDNKRHILNWLRYLILNYNNIRFVISHFVMHQQDLIRAKKFWFLI